MEYVTKGCAASGHPEFRIDVDAAAVPESLVQHFLDGLAGMVATGSVFKAGETLQIGWMITKVEALPNGDLTLHEPDMTTLPIAFKLGLTETLRHEMIQLYTHDSLGFPRDQILIPTLQHGTTICTRCEQADSIVLARAEPFAENDSGWFIGCLEEDHDHDEVEELEGISLYGAVLMRPEVLGWLYLPPPITVVLEPGQRPQIFRDEEIIEIEKDSFLDQLFARRGG